MVPQYTALAIVFQTITGGVYFKEFQHFFGNVLDKGTFEEGGAMSLIGLKTE